MTSFEQVAAIAVAVLVVVYLVGRPILEMAERFVRAAERSATANELTALYARELCWRVHDLPQTRNGLGELMQWQDPAEIFGIASNILAETEAEKRADVKRRREEINGYPDPTSKRGTDVGPEAEAAKAASAESMAKFNEMLAVRRKPKTGGTDDPEPIV